MDEDLQHLLKVLGLRRVEAIIAAELGRAAQEHPSYTQFLARLLREQYHYRQERSLAYRLEQAKIPEKWSLATFPFDRQAGVQATIIAQLAELDFIPRAENIVFIGPTGAGKTGLATGILLKALENGYRGLFIKAQDLFDEMYTSLADRSTRKMLARLAAIDLVVIDEMGYLNLRPEQSNMFFKLMDERYCRKSTILTTNLTYDEWYAFLGNKQMVGALLDRLRHKCRTIAINGPSLRAPVAAGDAEAAPAAGPVAGSPPERHGDGPAGA